MRYARGLHLALWVAIGACATAPSGSGTASTDTAATETDTDTDPTTSSTTFPYDTGFGGVAEVSPNSFLNVTEIGFWDLTGSDDAFSGRITLQEVVDELDIELGPDCFVTWNWTGEDEVPNTCADCAFVMTVNFTLLTGDPSTCRSPDRPVEGDVWRLGWNPTTNEVLRDMGGLGVWVPWYTGARSGNRIDITYDAVYAIEAPEEEMTQ